MFFKWLFPLAVIVTQAFTLVPEDNVQQILSERRNTVAFYNVYASNEHFHGIVQRQLKTINGSGLLDKLDTVFYATSGERGREYDIGSSSKYIHIEHHENNGGELQTLNLLHQFCHTNPRSKVLYFHDKGSYHYNENNKEFVKLLNCYVLNTHCIDALDSHDTCGWRISPFPAPHYSGNFWWARCSYVNTLISPMAVVNNQTFIEKAKDLNDCVGVKDRLFAEFWIGTGPRYLPADCMNATIDTSFVFTSYGYTFPKIAHSFCHGPDKHSGLSCQTASTYKDAALFRETISHISQNYKKPVCRDNYDEVIKATRMMYGQDPHTYIEWMSRLYKNDKLPESALIRFQDSPQVFIVRNGVLRSVPNLETFLSLGKDFSEVKVLQTKERHSYRFGLALLSV